MFKKYKTKIVNGHSQKIKSIWFVLTFTQTENTLVVSIFYGIQLTVYNRLKWNLKLILKIKTINSSAGNFTSRR